MSATPPATAELQAALGAALAPAGIRVRSLTRRPSPYRTSYPLEEVDVEAEDGTVQIAFKDLARTGLDDDARLAKPAFLHDPLREIAVYEQLLGPAQLGTARFYGSEVAPDRGRYWLFIERVDGAELYQVGERRLWEAAASWLAEAHEALAPAVERGSQQAHLVQHDRSYYQTWIERAMRFAESSRPRESQREIAAIARHYPGVAEFLADLPRTVIHGELYASNVLVSDGSRPRVCPIDWEVAGVGSGLIDLAALTTGPWRAGERSAIIDAYRSKDGNGLDEVSSDRALVGCRLHLAVQWLGWAPAEWNPPPDHRHDWLGEAKRAARELGL